MKAVLLIHIVLLLMACKPKSDLLFNEEMVNNIPDTVIPALKMAEVLTDIHLAESAIQELKTDSLRRLKDLIIVGYYADILQLHDVTFQTFKGSYDYYTQHPLLMNYVYKQVTSNLSLLESKSKIK